MLTGKDNKDRRASRAVDLQFKGDRVVLALTDGREISIPLDFYPTLQRASQRARNAWEMIGKGHGFHWPALDLDLSVQGLIQGLREVIPEPPRRATRKKPRAHAAGFH
jgi:hypothetical protein